MNDPDSSMISNIIILLIFIGCRAFFTMSEVAIISLNDNKIKKMAQQGNKKAKMITKMVDEPSQFLTMIQMGLTLFGFLAAAQAAHVFAHPIAAQLSVLPVAGNTLYGIALVLTTIVLAYLTLVFGHFVPKRIAMHHYERISFSVTPALYRFSVLAKPFLALVSLTSNGILRLIGINPHHMPEEVTEEEIRLMIDVGGESGTIEQSEKDMLNNIFEFDDSIAGEIMTHRTDIAAVDLSAPLEEIIAVALESGHSRIPVYDEDLDTIAGILYVKDLLSLITTELGKHFDLKHYIRAPLYVLESTKLSTLLSEFKQKKIQLAIVIDEYGGTSGLVSMEDLLEEIVGNIQDEYDNEEEEIVAIDDHQYLVDGLAPLDEVLAHFSVEIPDEDEYDTIGGFVINELGYIPAEGDHPQIVLQDLRITVQEIEDRRIVKLLIEQWTEEQESIEDSAQ